MKIAVASDKGYISTHFGYCEEFMIFDVKDNKITHTESIPNPGHKPGFLPNFLHELGINVIIAGGIGASAVSIFNRNNIEVIIGAVGKTEDMVGEYLKGNLKSTGTVCHQHQQ